MNKFKNGLSAFMLVSIAIFGLVTQASSQNRINDRDTRDIINNLHSGIDNFRSNLDSEFRRGANNRNNRNNRNDRNEINSSLKNLDNSVSQFESNYQRRRDSADDVRNILNAAKTVDDFVNRNNFNGKGDRDWTNIRGLLDRLASNYGVSWSWSDNNSRYPNDNRDPNNNNYPPVYSSANNLTGTYQLDVSRSDKTDEIADRAIRNGNVRNNDDAQRDLENKLQAPEQLAIEVRGNQVILASSNSKQISFMADGRESSETLDDGRTIRVRSTLRGQELTVSSLGGDNDYTVVFASIENGNALRVTRQITTNYLRQTIFAESIYRKSDKTAQLGDYDNSDDVYSNNNGDYSSNDPNDRRGNSPNNNGRNYPTTRTGRTGTFIVPNGAILTGTLESDIDTKVSQNNDRFRMTIQSPNQYRGAIVEGYISGVDRSGKVSGRSQLTFNFERIRMPNGQTYDFAGYLQSVTNEKGEIVKVDNEGVIKGDSQTKETVTRGGIGAGIGAIIGAIAGGGKGAAIGAIIGGGAGAGSVIFQGKDDLQLKAGSSITVQSSSPVR